MAERILHLCFSVHVLYMVQDVPSVCDHGLLLSLSVSRNAQPCFYMCVFAPLCVAAQWHASGLLPPFHPISRAQLLPVSAVTLATGLEETKSNSNLKNLLIKASLVEFDST